MKGLLILGTKGYEDQSMYDVSGDPDDLVLKFSQLQQSWTRPGKTAYALINTGNELVFEEHIPSQNAIKSIKLSYDAAQALRALLKLEDTEVATFEYFERKA